MYCVNAQADLNFHSVHMSKSTFSDIATIFCHLIVHLYHATIKWNAAVLIYVGMDIFGRFSVIF